MSQIESLLDGRFDLWVRELSAWGYVVEDPPQPPWLENQIRLFARRPENAGPPTTITITEQWTVGVEDPAKLGRMGLAREGCTLVSASWHAQIDENAHDPATRALRLDVDPTKPADLRIHRHPFNKPNDIREPATELPQPTDWIDDVEATIADR